MEELHICLSHIRVETICKILIKGMITGVRLDLNHSTMGQCASCEYGKATQKPIWKVCELSHSEKLGDEVHINIWGPLLVQTPGKQSYYSSFTEDHTYILYIHMLVSWVQSWTHFRLTNSLSLGYR